MITNFDNVEMPTLSAGRLKVVLLKASVALACEWGVVHAGNP